MPGARATHTTHLARGALVVAALGLMAWRGPQYLLAPSFWAEEGAFFFTQAWTAARSPGWCNTRRAI